MVSYEKADSTSDPPSKGTFVGSHFSVRSLTFAYTIDVV
jgi:hypothetical protein